MLFTVGFVIPVNKQKNKCMTLPRSSFYFVLYLKNKKNMKHRLQRLGSKIDQLAVTAGGMMLVYAVIFPLSTLCICGRIQYTSLLLFMSCILLLRLIFNGDFKSVFRISVSFVIYKI